MQLFFDENITGKKNHFLNEIDSYHAIKVLRKKQGDILDITDGKGKHYKTQIVLANPKKCSVNVLEEKLMPKNRDYFLHIAIAPPKNIDRFEWFVEKAVEIGIDKITPVICRYSERKKIKTERTEKIIISAMKQSLKFYKPQLEPIVKFEDFVAQANADNKFIALCNSEKSFKNIRKYQKNIILIGPEGGFSSKEINFAKENNYTAVKLSNSRLRTETAAVVSAASIAYYFLNFIE
jgi:16S rRNA (uracil1498-N3)-methyltransferase